MRPAPHAGCPQQGWSLVQVMVGLLVGMLAILVLTEAVILFQRQKEHISAGNNASSSAVLGLSLLERDVAMAGYGLSVASGCRLSTASLAFPFARLAAVLIEPGNAGSDSLVLSRASVAVEPEGQPLASAWPGNGPITLGSPPALAKGDMVVLAEPGEDCSLLSIESVNGPVLVTSGAGGLPAYSTSALVSGLGRAVLVRYVVRSGALERQSWQPAGNSWTTETLSIDVLALKAQYGLDLRPAGTPGVQVTGWSSSMVDADGDGVVGNEGDVRRIAALRVAVLARSGVREKTSGQCSTTTAAPAWRSGKLDGSWGSTAFPVDADPDWQCYRYHVIETTVALRNPLWQ